MEKLRLINKIKSLYIIKNNLLTYIEDDNFQLKLFIYSKSFQHKLNIKLLDYQEKLLNKI